MVYIIYYTIIHILLLYILYIIHYTYTIIIYYIIYYIIYTILFSSSVLFLFYPLPIFFPSKYYILYSSFSPLLLPSLLSSSDLSFSSSIPPFLSSDPTIIILYLSGLGYSYLYYLTRIIPRQSSLPSSIPIFLK